MPSTKMLTPKKSHGGEVLDLGKVEGLSAAPSTLRDLTASETIGIGKETTESDTMVKIDESATNYGFVRSYRAVLFYEENQNKRVGSGT